MNFQLSNKIRRCIFIILLHKRPKKSSRNDREGTKLIRHGLLRLCDNETYRIPGDTGNAKIWALACLLKPR